MEPRRDAFPKWSNLSNKRRSRLAQLRCACKEEYKKAFKASKECMKFRPYCLSGFSSLLADRSAYPATDDDIAFLTLITRDETESTLIRMMGSRTLKEIYEDLNDRERQAKYLRKVIALHQAATELELNSRVCAGHCTEAPARIHMDSIALQAQANLERMDHTTRNAPLAPFPSPVLRAATNLPPGSPAPLVIGAMDPEIKRFVVATEADKEALTPGGMHCDDCVYCDVKCQTAGWVLHKKRCCKPGTFLPGDRALLKGLQVRPELNNSAIAS